MSTRLIFMGSPDFSLPSLLMLAKEYSVIGVVTQPDRPAGRGRLLTPPPVKELAVNLGIPCIQPNRLKDPGTFEQLQAWAPDLMVVAAFGQILRQNVLDLPPLGCINVHASLLPRWRGAAPIQAAILNGDRETGVTIMKMDAGVDTGAILSQRSLEINPADTSKTLSRRLSALGAALLAETLPEYIAGKIAPHPQAEELATRAAMIQKEDGLLDFSLPAADLERRVRAFSPWPGTYFVWQGSLLKVLRSHVVPDSNLLAGQEGTIQKFPAIGTSQGSLVLDEIQPAGKKTMTGDVFLLGAHSWGGSK